MTEENKYHMDCSELYDAHTYCVGASYQLDSVRRHGYLQPCKLIFQDWKDCVQSNVTSDFDKKQVMIAFIKLI